MKKLNAPLFEYEKQYKVNKFLVILCVGLSIIGASIYYNNQKLKNLLTEASSEIDLKNSRIIELEYSKDNMSTTITFLQQTLERSDMYNFVGKYYKENRLVDGFYSTDKYFCVWTNKRSLPEIFQTYYHEVAHYFVETNYKHFCGNES